MKRAKRNPLGGVSEAQEDRLKRMFADLQAVATAGRQRNDPALFAYFEGKSIGVQTVAGVVFGLPPQFQITVDKIRKLSAMVAEADEKVVNGRTPLVKMVARGYVDQFWKALAVVGVSEDEFMEILED